MFLGDYMKFLKLLTIFALLCALSGVAAVAYSAYGSRGEEVREIQTRLAALGYYGGTIDGIYGRATSNAVLAAQRRFRLPETGVVDNITWDEIYDQYSGIENTTLRSTERFPTMGENTAVRTAANVRRGNSTAVNSNNLYSKTTTLTQFPGKNLSTGSKDPTKQEVVR